MCAVIGQFSGPYFPAQTAKTKSFLVAKLLGNCEEELHKKPVGRLSVKCRQIFSTYMANKSLKLSFTLNCVLKHANDLKTISN